MTRAEILRAVAERFDVSVDELKGLKAKRGKIRLARQAAMYELRAAGQWSGLQIGRDLNVDHSTVLHGADCHADRMGLPRLPRRKPPQTQRRRPLSKAVVGYSEGHMDGIRYGRVWVGSVSHAFRFDRLTGAVRLFKNDVSGQEVTIEITDPERVQAARLACVEKFGVIEP